MNDDRNGPCGKDATSTNEFRDDDAGYLAWLDAHPDGYVVNIARSHRVADARMHHAQCRTVSGQSLREGAWTDQYVKVCSERLDDLEQWAMGIVGESIKPCGTCRPTPNTATAIRPNLNDAVAAVPLRQARFHIQGPADGPVVEAWSEDYLRFERLPDWQRRLRTEIKTRCGQLDPSQGQVLHATFFGPKLANADVENVLLYNIDSFRAAGRNGIRFEHGAAIPPAPDGVEYPFGYRYALADESGDFDYWRQGRTLASFDWTDLSAFNAVKRPAQVWLALARGAATVFEPTVSHDAPFGVKVQIRPPHGRFNVIGSELVKEILDGVVCAFQAHTDTSVLPEVTARLATVLPADAAELEARLLDQSRAALGVVRRLVYPYRKSVKWDPADHLCVAGEVLLAEPVDERWAISGEIVELSR